MVALAILASVLGVAALVLIVVGIRLVFRGLSARSGLDRPTPTQQLIGILRNLIGILFGKDSSESDKYMAAGLVFTILGVIVLLAAIGTGIAAGAAAVGDNGTGGTSPNAPTSSTPTPSASP